MRAKIVIATATLVIFAFASAATAATIVKMTVQEGADDKAGRIGMTIERKRLRMDFDPADGQERTSIVFRGDRDEVMLLDHSKSEATILDKATVEQMAAQMRQAMEQMEAMMSKVPAEQREKMKQMMKGMPAMKGVPGMMAEPPAPVDVRKTSETGTTNGYAWVKYEAYQEDDKIQEFLVTDWSNLGIDASAFDVFKDMAAFFEEIGKSFGATMPVATDNPFEQMNRLGGFPVVTREVVGGKVVGSTRLDSVTTGEAEPGLFENPGYDVQEIAPPRGR